MEKYVLYFNEIDQFALPYVGGKGANLGEMTKAGFPVPEGFAYQLPPIARSYKQAASSTACSTSLDSSSMMIWNRFGLRGSRFASILPRFPYLTRSNRRYWKALIRPAKIKPMLSAPVLRQKTCRQLHLRGSRIPF